MKEHVRPCTGKLDVECKFIPSFLNPKRHQVGSPLFFSTNEMEAGAVLRTALRGCECDEYIVLRLLTRDQLSFHHAGRMCVYKLDLH